MNDGAVRETSCTNCVHRPVCKNMRTYIDLNNEINQMLDNEEQRFGYKLDFIKRPVELTCVNRMEKPVNPIDISRKMEVVP